MTAPATANIPNVQNNFHSLVFMIILLPLTALFRIPLRCAPGIYSSVPMGLVFKVGMKISEKL